MSTSQIQRAPNMTSSTAAQATPRGWSNLHGLSSPCWTFFGNLNGKPCPPYQKVKTENLCVLLKVHVHLLYLLWQMHFLQFYWICWMKSGKPVKCLNKKTVKHIKLASTFLLGILFTVQTPESSLIQISASACWYQPCPKYMELETICRRRVASNWKQIFGTFFDNFSNF